MKRLLAVLALASLGGCSMTFAPATIEAVQQQALTARRTSENFQLVAPKLAARDPADAGAVDLWRVQHAVNLEAQASGLEALARRVKE
jgi:hypothetical protein